MTRGGVIQFLQRSRAFQIRRERKNLSEKFESDRGMERTVRAGMERKKRLEDADQLRRRDPLGRVREPTM